MTFALYKKTEHYKNLCAQTCFKAYIKTGDMLAEDIDCRYSEEEIRCDQEKDPDRKKKGAPIPMAL